MNPPKNEIIQPPKVLSIAGSDSGGAAGLQADLKTFTTFGVYGMSAVTAVTAQNSEEIRVVHPVPDEVVAAQIDAVLGDYGADAVKTGFIGRVDSIKTIAELLQSHKPANIIIDPVIVSHRGDLMFPDEVVQAYVTYLLPIADLITPNLAEALILSVPANLAAVPVSATAARSKSKVSLPVLSTVKVKTLSVEPDVTATAAASSVTTVKSTLRSTRKAAVLLVSWV